MPIQAFRPERFRTYGMLKISLIISNYYTQIPSSYATLAQKSSPPRRTWKVGLIQAPKKPNTKPSGPLLAHPEKLQRGAEVGGEGGVDLDLLVGVKRIGEL